MSGYALRREDKFMEKFTLRDRLRNVPIYCMRRMLNVLEKSLSLPDGDRVFFMYNVTPFRILAESIAD